MRAGRFSLLIFADALREREALGMLLMTLEAEDFRTDRLSRICGNGGAGIVKMRSSGFFKLPCKEKRRDGVLPLTMMKKRRRAKARPAERL